MNAGKRKKTTGGQWLGILIYLLIGLACGALFMMYLDRAAEAGLSRSGRILSIPLMFVCLYGALIISVIIHEAGHLVFGLLTGYRFCAFRIFSWTWMKEDGRIRFRKMNIAGTGGQCLMAPPELRDGKMPVMLYNFGGAILNLAAAALCLGLSFLCAAFSLPWVILMYFTIIGVAFALINGLPLKMGAVNNDGRNARDLAESGEATRAFWIQMKVNEQISRGIRVKDMPDEWFEVPSGESMKNGIIAPVGVLACGRLMDEHRFGEAEAMMKRLLSGENGIVGVHRSLMTCDRMYMEMISENRAGVLETMRSKEQLKFMKAMRKYPSVLRTEYVYTLLTEKDSGKAEGIRKAFEKCAAAYPYPGEVQSERELMEIAEERAGVAR